MFQSALDALTRDKATWWNFSETPNCEAHPRSTDALEVTVGVVEHAEGIGVVVAKELSLDDGVVLPNQLQVAPVEMRPVPRLAPLLLKHPRGHVADDVHLQDKERRAQEWLRRGRQQIG